MREITLEELLEAGCHFGHQVTRQNPKARDFVFEARDNIHIIDLAKTKEGLEQAAEFVRNLAQKGGTIIVIGAKRQAQGIVKNEVERAHKELADTLLNNESAGIFSVTNRWIGGTITNFSEVSKNYNKLKDYHYKLQSEEEKALYTKKEVGLWEKDMHKLESYYGGTSAMTKIPDALFIIDTHMEDLAVREARAMGVTTVGIVDTNADPFVIDYPIPANDDAIGSIQLITAYIIDAWVEGKKNKVKGDKIAAASNAAAAEQKLALEQTAKQDSSTEQKTEAKGETKQKLEEEKKSTKKTATKKASEESKASPTEEKPKRGRKPKTQ